MYLLSWSSSARNDKVAKEKANFMPAQEQQSSMTQIPLLNKMKRKRSDGSPASPLLEYPSPKRRTETMSHVEIPATETQKAILPRQEDQADTESDPDQTNQGHILTEMEWKRINGSTHLQNRLPEMLTQRNFDHHDSDTSRLPKTMTAPAALREAIEAQFSLEILLKHRELRLIEQEFAKCQIALEQLRRCQIFPYPASSSTFEGMQAASTGSGAAYDNRAPYAPPWGVANGPYTRHYERWLIPDSAFDDSVADHKQTPTCGGEFVPERATRGSKAEKGIVAGKSRSQRGSNGARLKALPHGYPEPKEEKGPMIVKRSSDGKMVKLVCLDCRRSNFNSAQGFINHCRIAHSRQFLSHDAAIEASGEEVDMDMEGGLGESSGSQASASAGLVHPLIRSALARTTPADSTTSSSRRKKPQSAATPKDQLPIAFSSAQAMSTPRPTDFGMPKHPGTDPVPFNPSPQTPHLSALFARVGRGGNLNDMVAQAKTSPEIDLSLSSDEEDEQEEVSPTEKPGGPQSRSTRGVVQGRYPPARATKSPTPLERSPTHLGVSNSLYKADLLPTMNEHYSYQSPYHSRDQQQDHGMPIHGNASPLNLSPNTIESHTAPSLVSDDGDYENTHSESETPSSGEADDDEDHYIHAEVIDHDEMDMGEGSSHDHHLSLGGKPRGPAAGRRSSALRHPSAIRDEAGEDRHVSFASPVRRLGKGSRAKDDV
ncbi:hypothetical protein HO133_010684 [Letharia lupina]|uniref:AHC1-like C2H2 zinc-finger domain-containing protein n=1 Tax=Letharia lupina TaxID=560253 RepID=A0A8H6CIQ7_9LECA|nr:uncharacterized protein HO133_010684 [Letharia lupina]KAF6224110.1 hypothetical protein HO133_010684 [Letharia lupina]